MDTEQQQEFKSEKRRTGSQIKTILFTDHSIESWRPKKDRDRLCFARSNITKGIKVIYRKKTNQKYWELTYFLKKRKLSTSLGPFVPGVRGTEYLAKEMLDLISKHKDLRRTLVMVCVSKTYGPNK